MFQILNAKKDAAPKPQSQKELCTPCLRIEQLEERVVPAITPMFNPKEY